MSTRTSEASDEKPPLPPWDSNGIVMKDPRNVPGPGGVAPHKVLVPGRSLGAPVPRQHRLDTHAHALDVMHGRPAGAVEQVEAYDPVRVDVWVHGHRPGRGRERREGDLWRLWQSAGQQDGAQERGIEGERERESVVLELCSKISGAIGSVGFEGLQL